MSFSDLPPGARVVSGGGAAFSDIPPGARVVGTPQGQEVAPTAPAETAGEAAMRIPGRAARMALQGVLQVPDMLNNAGAAVLNAPFVAYDAIRGNAPGTSEPFQYGAIAGAGRRVADEAGLPQYPNTPAGRVIGAIGEGAAGGVGVAPLARQAAGALTGTAQTVARAFSDAPGVDMAAGAVGGGAQGLAAEAGVGQGGQMAANLGGNFGTVLASAIIAAVARRRASMPRESIPPDPSAVTPEEVAAVWSDPDVQAIARANGITDPADPRVGVLSERLQANRTAEAAPVVARVEQQAELPSLQREAGSEPQRLGDPALAGDIRTERAAAQAAIERIDAQVGREAAAAAEAGRPYDAAAARARLIEAERVQAQPLPETIALPAEPSGPPLRGTPDPNAIGIEPAVQAYGRAGDPYVAYDARRADMERARVEAESAALRDAQARQAELDLQAYQSVRPQEPPRAGPPPEAPPSPAQPAAGGDVPALRAGAPVGRGDGAPGAARGPAGSGAAGARGVAEAAPRVEPGPAGGSPVVAAATRQIARLTRNGEPEPGTPAAQQLARLRAQVPPAEGAPPRDAVSAPLPDRPAGSAPTTTTPRPSSADVAPVARQPDATAREEALLDAMDEAVSQNGAVGRAFDAANARLKEAQDAEAAHLERMYADGRRPSRGDRVLADRLQAEVAAAQKARDEASSRLFREGPGNYLQDRMAGKIDESAPQGRNVIDGTAEDVTPRRALETPAPAASRDAGTPPAGDAGRPPTSSSGRGATSDRVTGYHGTGERIDRFDPGQTRLNRGAFFSDKPDLANRFALGKAGDNDPVAFPDDADFLPTMREYFGSERMAKIEADHAEMMRRMRVAEQAEARAPDSAETWRAWDAYREKYNALVDDGMDAGSMFEGRAPQMYRAKLDLGKTLKHEFKDRFDWGEEKAVIDRARREGYDSVTFTTKSGDTFYSMLDSKGIDLYSGIPFTSANMKRFLADPAMAAARRLKQGLAASAKAGRIVGDPARWYIHSARAVFDAVADRYPNIPEVRQLRDMLATAPGTGRVVTETFETAATGRHRAMTNRAAVLIGRNADEATRVHIGDMLEGTARPRNATETAQVQNLRKLLDEQHAYLKKAGVEIGYQKGYFPGAYDIDKILADTTAFEAAVTTSFRRRFGMSEADARAAAEEWSNRLMGVGGDGFSGAAHGPPSSFRKGRVLPPEVRADLKEWRVRDAGAALANYFQQTSQHAEFVRRFGENASKTGEMFQAMARGGMTEREIKLLQEEFAAATGTLRPNEVSSARAAASAVQTHGIMSVMGRAVLSSVAEPAAIGARAGNPITGLKAVIDTWGSIVKRVASGDPDSVRPELRFLSEVAGIIEDRGARMAQMQAAINGGTLGAKQRAAVDGLFTRTGLHALTEESRITATGVGQKFVAQITDEIANGAPTVASAKRLAAELGMDEATAKQVHGWLKTNPTPMEMLSDAPAATAYRTALRRFVNESIVNPEAIDRPGAAAHHRLAYGITSFMFAFTRSVLLRSLKSGIDGLDVKADLTLRDRARLLAPLSGFMALGAMQFGMSEYLREPLMNKLFGQEKPAPDPFVASIRGLDRWGLFGNLSPIVNLISSAKYDTDPSRLLVGPYTSNAVNAFGTMTAGMVPTPIGRNSPNTNNAEHAAMRALHALALGPAIAAGLSIMPAPGRVATAAAGAGIMALSSRQAGRALADATVGEPTTRSRTAGRGGRQSETRR